MPEPADIEDVFGYPTETGKTVGSVSSSAENDNRIGVKETEGKGWAYPYSVPSPRRIAYRFNGRFTTEKVRSISEMQYQEIHSRAAEARRERYQQIAEIRRRRQNRQNKGE